MTIPETVSGGQVPDAVVYYGPGYAEQAERMRPRLEQFPTLSLAEYRPVSDARAHGRDDRLTLVFTDAVPAEASLPALAADPAIWVTTDPAVTRTAVEWQVTDVFTWESTHGWEILETKLRHRLADRRESRVDGEATTGAPERALQRISDGVLALDDDCRITYINNAMAAVLADTGVDLRGDVVWEHMSASATAALKPVFERAMRQGATETTEFQSDATGEWYEVTVYPSAEGVSVYGREITERKERENQQAMYEHLVKTVGDAVYILDSEGRFTFVNDALCEMSGYSREELLGSMVHIIKDDRTVAEAERALADLLRQYGGETESMPIAKLDVELVTKDGQRLPATDRMTLRPLEDGEFGGTVGTLRDISRQQRRQNILSGLLTATQDMMTATTTDEVAEQVVETVTGVFDVDLVTVRAHDPEGEVLAPVAVSEAVEELMEDRPPYRPGDGPVGTAFSEGRLVVREDLADIDDGYDRRGAEVGVYCPIGDRRILSIGTDAGEGFTDDELRLVELLAETAAAAFEMVAREEELERYRTVVEAADDRLFTLDEDGTVTLATEEFAAMVGHDRASVTGRHVGEFVPDDVAAALADRREPADVETDLRTADGDRLPSRIRTATFDSPYECGVVATVQDISELRSAKQAATRNRRRFAELFETLSDPVADLAHTADGACVKRANAAFADLSRDLDGDVRDQPLSTLQETLPAELADAIDPLHTPGQSLETEVTVRTGAERRRYILKSVPYEGEDGERAFLILTDVTDLTQRETHLKVLHRLLRHNLRNETSVIQGYAESIVQHDPEPRVATFAERIRDASSSLVEASDRARTIQRVLQMEAEQPESVPVAEATRELTTRLDSLYPGADLTVTNRTDGTTTFSHHLLVGVEELVDNAVEHGSPTPREDSDGPTVEVEFVDGPDPETVTIRVHDDGPGIPEEEWAVVVGDREITQLQHTQGLGLWLVRWVVDNHGGTLELERTGPDGTTVAVTLPR